MSAGDIRDLKRVVGLYGSLLFCLLTGGAELWEHACSKMGIGHKEVTPDGRISLEEVECMGACSWAPAVEINYDFHHFVTPQKLDQVIDDLRKAQ